MQKYSDIYSRPIAMNMVEDNGKIWMALMNRSGICEIDKTTRQARICKTFEEKPLGEGWLYSYVEKAGHYLILAPGGAEKIAIYDLECDSMIYIPLKKVECRYRESRDGAKFWNIIRHHSEVYLLGYSYPAIVKIDIESMEITYITDWVKEVEENIEEGDNCGYFGDGYIVKDNSALIPVGCMNAVMELSFATACTRLIKLGISMRGVGGLASEDGENVWLVGKKSRTNKVYNWNMRINEIKEYYLPDEPDDILDPFYAPICTNSKVILFPMSAFGIYEIKADTGEIKKSIALGGVLKNTQDSLWLEWKTLAPKINGNLITFLTCDDLCWHEYDVVSGEIQNYYIQLEEEGEELEQYFDVVYSKGRAEKNLCLEKNVSLKYFINQIQKKNDPNLFQNVIRDRVGKKIYEQV